MLNPTYLVRSRHQIFYFRWPLPKVFRQDGRTTHVKLSLRTREPKEALRLANILGYHANDLISKKSVAQMKYIEIKQMLEDYFQDLLQYSKREIDDEGPFPPEQVDSYKALIARNENLDAYNKFMADLSKVIPGNPEPHLRSILSHAHVEMDKDSPDYARLGELCRQAAIAYYHNLLAYSEEQSRFSFLLENIGSLELSLPKLIRRVKRGIL